MQESADVDPYSIDCFKSNRSSNVRVLISNLHVWACLSLFVHQREHPACLHQLLSAPACPQPYLFFSDTNRMSWFLTQAHGKDRLRILCTFTASIATVCVSKPFTMLLQIQRKFCWLWKEQNTAYQPSATGRQDLLALSFLNNLIAILQV